MLHGLKQGNEVLKEIHKEMNIESVEKLLDETAEARQYQQVHAVQHTVKLSDCSHLSPGNRGYAGKQSYA